MTKRSHMISAFRSAAAAMLGAASLFSAAQANDPPELEFVFEETVTLGTPIDVGQTANGGRAIIPITGGVFEGPEMRGEVMPGGWDWQLIRPDGCRELLANYFLKSDDGVVINIINEAVACEGGDPDAPMHTFARLEPPLGKYEDLAKTRLVGVANVIIEEDGWAIRIRFYRPK